MQEKRERVGTEGDCLMATKVEGSADYADDADKSEPRNRRNTRKKSTDLTRNMAAGC